MNADLVAQIVKLATDSKKRSTSKVIDGWQDQIVALAKQIQPEGAAPVVAGLTVQPTSGTVEVGSSIVFQAFGWVAGASQPIQPAVTWASTGGHISTSGTYTAGATPGTFQVTAKLVNGPQEETVPIVVMGKLPATNPPTPGANPTPTPTKLAMSTQPSGARDSTLFDTQPAARLQDVSSANVSQAGRTVTVSITSGTGSLSGTTSALTDNSGIATFTDLKIVGSGAHTLTFASTGLTSVASSSFTVNAASKVVIVTHPSSATSGVAITSQPVVRLQDANSLNVTKSGVNITVAIASGSGSITAGSTTVATDSSGIVTYSGLAITGSGAHTLQFTSTGLTTATSNSFTVDAGGGTAALTFDPANFANTAALLAATGTWTPYTIDDAHPFVAVEDINVSGNVTLETGTGYAGRTKFMRYTFTASGSEVERTIGRAMALNHLDSGQDIWVDCAVRISSNFNASFSANSFYGVPAYKFLFMMFPGTGRFQQTFVWDNRTMEIGDAASEDRGSISIPNICDDQWHRIQWHVKVNPTTGKNIIYMDGVQVYSRTGDTGPVDKGEWYAFAMGRNSNRGFAQTTTVDWGLVKKYTSDPGWGF